MLCGSLFSGIGGLDLGLERSIPGAKTVWQVEQNKYARAVLAKHWPEAKRYNDVREVGAHNLERVDLISGGWPCQDISWIGKGAGITGERSGLWEEFARIIRELGPRYVVLENSPALAYRGMGAVLGALAACGYDAVWNIVPARFVGAHHKRDRIFIVAHARGPAVQKEQKLRTGGRSTAELARDGRIWQMARREIGPWPAEPPICRVANGIPRRMDRLRCLGNAVVPQVAQVIGRVIVELESGRGW